MPWTFTRKYATLTVTGTTAIAFTLTKRGTADQAVGADWTPAAGDVKCSIDGGAASNVTNLPTAVTMGNTAYWQWIATAAELTGKRIVMTIGDAATKAVEDDVIIVETFGHASAMYPTDYSALADQAVAKETHGVSGTVWHVAASGGSDSNAGTSWAAPLATVQHALTVAAARDMVSAGPGIHTVDTGTGLTIPAGVILRGAGRKVTELQYGTGNALSLVPGNNSVIENLTLHTTFDDPCLTIGGSTQVTGAEVRNCDLISDNLECVTVTSSQACTVRFENVYMQSYTEWALTASGATHQIAFDRVTTYTVANPSPDDAKACRIQNGSLLIATNSTFLASDASAAGKVFKVEDASAVHLANCVCFDGDMNIASSSGYVMTSQCSFNRTKVTGNPSRLVDISGGVWDTTVDGIVAGDLLAYAGAMAAGSRTYTDLGNGSFQVTIGAAGVGGATRITGTESITSRNRTVTALTPPS